MSGTLQTAEVRPGNLSKTHHDGVAGLDASQQFPGRLAGNVQHSEPADEPGNDAGSGYDSICDRFGGTAHLSMMKDRMCKEISLSMMAGLGAMEIITMCTYRSSWSFCRVIVHTVWCLGQFFIFSISWIIVLKMQFSYLQAFRVSRYVPSSTKLAVPLDNMIFDFHPKVNSAPL